VPHLLGLTHIKRLTLEIPADSRIDSAELVPMAKVEDFDRLNVRGHGQGGSDVKLWIKVLRRDRFEGVAAIRLGWCGRRVLDRVIDEMPHLQSISFHESEIAENSLGRLHELQYLEELDLSGGELQAPGTAIENVSRVKTLKRLRLNSARITDEDLLKLGPLPDLEELSLSSARVTDEGVERVARLFPDLEVLKLRQVLQITDRSAKAVSQLGNLRELDISMTRITDSGVEYLAALPRLEALDLPSAVTDRGLVHVGKLRQLRHLDAGGTVESPAGLASLSGLTKLESLIISHAKIGDEDLKHLAQLTRLRWLDLSHTKLDGSGLVHLLKMRSLQRLELQRTRTQPEHFAKLAELRSLRELILWGSPVGGDEGVEALRQFPFVKFMRVSVSHDRLMELYRALPHCYIYSN